MNEEPTLLEQELIVSLGNMYIVHGADNVNVGKIVERIKPIIEANSKIVVLEARIDELRRTVWREDNIYTYTEEKKLILTQERFSNLKDEQAKLTSGRGE